MTPSAQAGAPGLPGRADPRPITDAEFALFQGLIRREAGIFLIPAKKALLEGRLARRLRELGLRSFGAYYRRVVEEDREELVRLLDCVCTNETHFFREPQHFDFLHTRIIPEWVAQAAAGQRPRLVRAWSAACSTGEEPYSLAMTLLDQLPPSAGWEIEILATDLSTRALDQARSGIWPLEKASEIPAQHLKRYMLKGARAQAGKMKAGPALRSLIRFQRLNLSGERYAVTGLFDLIFCRNVLIYFDPEMRARVTSRLLDHLDPAGYLFLGHAETLNGVSDRFRSVLPTVYGHARDPQRAPDVPRERPLGAGPGRDGSAG